MRGRILWGVLAWAFLLPPACAVEVRGVVFADRNYNGVRDAGEPGLARIPVSDGNSFALTDSNGAYTLEVEKLPTAVFVILPSGYTSFRFWRLVEREGEGTNFPLVPEPVLPKFTFVQVSDVNMVWKPECLLGVRRFIKEVAELRPAFVVATGDLVLGADRMRDERKVEEAFELYRWEMGRLHAPRFDVIGNRDHCMSLDPKSPCFWKGAYLRHLGPLYYAFNCSGVHFVVLDATSPRPPYAEEVYEKELTWLREELKFVPRNRPIILLSHQPLAYCFGYEKLLKVLEGRKVLAAFAGHYYKNEEIVRGGIRHVVTQSLSGYQWAEPLLLPTPLGLELRASPGGYRVVEVSREGVSHYFKALGAECYPDDLGRFAYSLCRGAVSFKFKLPKGMAEGVRFRLGEFPRAFSAERLSQNRWEEWEMKVDTTLVGDGFQPLIVYPFAKKRSWAYCIWLVVDNKKPFEARKPATLSMKVYGLDAPLSVWVNESKVAEGIWASDGATVYVRVPKEVLRKVNHVVLRSGTVNGRVDEFFIEGLNLEGKKDVWERGVERDKVRGERRFCIVLE